MQFWARLTKRFYEDKQSFNSAGKVADKTMFYRVVIFANTLFVPVAIGSYRVYAYQIKVQDPFLIKNT